MTKPIAKPMSAAEFRKRIEASGKTQGEIATELGVSIRSINRWANVDGTIPVTVAVAVRTLFPDK